MPNYDLSERKDNDKELVINYCENIYFQTKNEKTFIHDNSFFGANHINSPFYNNINYA